MTEVIFHCGRYPSLVLTVKPFGLKDPVGNLKPAKHLHFITDLKLGPGIFKAKNEEDANFVRNCEYFKSGKIIEVVDAADLPEPVLVDKVSTGVHDTRDVRTPSGEPKEVPREVKASRVPKRK